MSTSESGCVFHLMGTGKKGESREWGRGGGKDFQLTGGNTEGEGQERERGGGRGGGRGGDICHLGGGGRGGDICHLGGGGRGKEGQGCQVEWQREKGF